MKKPDKTYFKDGFEHKEYLESGKLLMKVSIHRTVNSKLTQIYSGDNELIQKTKIYYNKKGIPFRIKEWVSSSDGNDISTDFRIPIFPQYKNASTMSEEDKKIHSNLINEYLISDFVEPYE